MCEHHTIQEFINVIFRCRWCEIYFALVVLYFVVGFLVEKIVRSVNGIMRLTDYGEERFFFTVFWPILLFYKLISSIRAAIINK